jgi:spermidine/putrescine transport system substrate-binding protein
MTDPHDPVPSIRLTRRQAIVRGTQAAAALAGLPAILAACGGGGGSASEGSSTAAGTTPSEEISGDLRFATYPEWIGKHEYAKFHDLHPEVTIKEVGTNTTSTNGRAFLIRQNPEDYDFMLLGLSAAPILQADPKLIADLDHDKIPNLELIPEKFRMRYPFGIPTDYGKIGFGYRKDLISERPTKWADVWELAPKYSGKIVLLDGLEDCFGNVLLMLGYSGNSKVPSEIDAAKNKLLEIKPFLEAT